MIFTATSSNLLFLLICMKFCGVLQYGILQEAIAKEFLERLVTWAKNIKVSDPLEEGCRLGPVVSAGQVRILMILLSGNS